MKRQIGRAIAVGATVLAGGTALAQYTQPPLAMFTITDGETLMLRRVGAGCENILTKIDGIDVVEGKMPELSYRAELVKELKFANCQNPVAGGEIFVTAKGVTEPKNRVVTLRVRMDTKNGPWQNTVRVQIFVFPALEKDNESKD